MKKTETSTTSTDIALLPPAERAVIVLESSKTEEHLKELVKKSAEITAVDSKDAREQAHRAAMDLKNARTTINKTGKAARDDANAFSKAVIDEEKRLIAIIEPEETRVFGLRDEYDAKVAAEKAAAEAAEKARKDEILGKINGIRNLPLELANASSEEILAEMNALASFEPDPDVFAEFMEELQHALSDTCKALDALHTRVMAAETAQAALAAERKALDEERARIAAERAELEQLRAERDALQTAPEPVIISNADLVAIDHDQIVLRGHSEDPEEFFPSDNATEDSLYDGLPETVDGEIVDASFDGQPIEHVAEAISFEVRSFALATAEQFAAFADKVAAVGATAYADDLRAVAYGLREGDHDRAIAAANVEDLKAADNRLLDATVNAIDAWGEISAQAAE